MHDQPVTGNARWIGLAGWIALSFAAALPGVFVTSAADYETLAQPAWAPPPDVFGPVWSVLYVLMGVAAWLVWEKRGWSGARTALVLFLVQLALNALWTPVFFGAGLRGLAFGIIVALVLALGATAEAFRRIRPLAGALLVPYLLWVLFAAALNFSIWQLN